MQRALSGNALITIKHLGFLLLSHAEGLAIHVFVLWTLLKRHVPLLSLS